MAVKILLVMFETLSERLQSVFKKLRGRGKLSESDVADAMREVRMALLEADVSLKVVKEFISSAKEKATGAEVMESLTPAQAVIRIVRDELVRMLGEPAKLSISPTPPTLIMLAGLQGSGKTTTCGKLALHLKNEGHRPLLAAADIYRPAAIKQLQVLGSELDIPVYALGEKSDPVQIAKGAVAQAQTAGNGIVILDTAGRLHLDEPMMEELKKIKSSVQPAETLLVADAMTGQEAVAVALRFHRDLALTGIVITKMDGDARGGAALSIRSVTGCPVKFIGTGEKMKALEPFYPDRLVSRILGMGDVLTLIEKVEKTVDEKRAFEIAEKLRKAEFTLEDYLDQLQQIKKMGPLQDILGMLPGNLFPGADLQKQLKNMKPAEGEFKKIEAVIQSMTRQERLHPSVINASRRRRIAGGSGTEVSDVNQVLKNYETMRKMLKQFAGMEKKMSLPGFPRPFTG